MSNKPQAKPAVRQKPLTEAEVRGLKRSLEYVADDCKRVCTPNFVQPFNNLRDAVERLVPYHVFGALDAEEADLEESSDQAGADLLCSRQTSWTDVSFRQASEVCKRIEDIRQRLAYHEHKATSRHAALGIEEKLWFERLLTREMQSWIPIETITAQLQPHLLPALAEEAPITHTSTQPVLPLQQSQQQLNRQPQSQQQPQQLANQPPAQTQHASNAAGTDLQDQAIAAANTSAQTLPGVDPPRPQGVVMLAPG